MKLGCSTSCDRSSSTSSTTPLRSRRRRKREPEQPVEMLSGHPNGPGSATQLGEGVLSRMLVLVLILAALGNVVADLEFTVTDFVADDADGSCDPNNVCTSLSAALEAAAASGDPVSTIQLPSDGIMTWSTSLLVTGDLDVSIEPLAPAGLFEMRGEGAALLEVAGGASVKVSNGKFNATSPSIFEVAEGSSLSLTDCSFGGSGAVTSDRGQVMVAGCEFEGVGSGGRRGGAISATGGELEVRQSSFTECVGSHGGAISATGLSSALLLEEVNFIACVAEVEGGALSLVDSDSLLTDVLFDSNEAIAPGSLDAGFTVDYGQVFGGAAVIRGGVHSGSGCSFVQNAVYSSYVFEGGALFLASAELSLLDSAFTGNDGGQQGGAVKYISSSRLSFTNVQFEANTAGSRGGALLGSGGSLRCEQCTFTGNVAADKGGGIFTSGNTVLIDSSFTGNSALDGGGVALVGGTSELDGCTFDANSFEPSCYELAESLASSASVAILRLSCQGGALYNAAATSGVGCTFSGINGFGNTTADPSFLGSEISNMGELKLVNSTFGDYHLGEGLGYNIWHDGGSLTVDFAQFDVAATVFAAPGFPAMIRNPALGTVDVLGAGAVPCDDAVDPPCSQVAICTPSDGADAVDCVCPAGTAGDPFLECLTPAELTVPAVTAQGVSAIAVKPGPMTAFILIQNAGTEPLGWAVAIEQDPPASDDLLLSFQASGTLNGAELLQLPVTADTTGVQSKLLPFTGSVLIEATSARDGGSAGRRSVPLSLTLLAAADPASSVVELFSSPPYTPGGILDEAAADPFLPVQGETVTVVVFPRDVDGLEAVGVPEELTVLLAYPALDADRYMRSGVDGLDCSIPPCVGGESGPGCLTACAVDCGRVSYDSVNNVYSAQCVMPQRWAGEATVSVLASSHPGEIFGGGQGQSVALAANDGEVGGVGCPAGLFLSAQEDRYCSPCPEEGVCPSRTTVRTLSLLPGYWRPTSNSLSIEECALQSECLGGVVVEDYCSEGSYGPECDSCVSDYWRVESRGECMACSAPSTTRIGVTNSLLFVAVFMVLGFVLWRLTGRVHSEFIIANDVAGGGNAEAAAAAHSFTARLMSFFHSRYIQSLQLKLKLLSAFLQIVTLLPGVLSFSFPSWFGDIMSYLSGFALDMFSSLPLSCAWRGLDFYDVLLFNTLAPLFACGAILVGFTAYSRLRYSDEARSGPKYDTERALALILPLVILWATYPVSVRTIFQTFVCTRYDDGFGSYLKADSNVQCYDSRYWGYAAYAMIMVIVIAVGVPVLFGTLLYQARGTRHVWDPRVMSTESRESIKSLRRHASYSVKEEEEALLIARQHQHLRFLTEFYKPSSYYWEVVELSRRGVVIGLLVIIGNGTSGQAALGMLVSLFYMLLYLHKRPFADSSDNLAAMSLQFGLVLNFFIIMLMQSGLSGENQDQYAASFLVVNTLVVVLDILSAFGEAVTFHFFDY